MSRALSWEKLRLQEVPFTSEPITLNRFIYAGANPINNTDPSGHDFLADVSIAIAEQISLASVRYPGIFFAARTIFAAANIYLFTADSRYREFLLAASAGNPFGVAEGLAGELAFLYSGFRNILASTVASVSKGEVILDFFGGATSELPGAISVDRIAEGPGNIRADISIGTPFPDGIADVVVASGPQSEFLAEAARVLKPGGRIYINANFSNPFNPFGKSKVNEDVLSRLGLKIVVENGPLDSQFANQVFRRSDGVEILKQTVKTTIIEEDQVNIIKEHFDDLFLQDADFGEPQWCGANLIVPACGVIALEKHPLGGGEGTRVNGQLRFQGVVASTRLQAEYRGNPKIDGFREPYTVIDHPIEYQPVSPTQTYSFAGMLLQPLAWVEWEVESASFEFVMDL